MAVWEFSSLTWRQAGLLISPVQSFTWRGGKDSITSSCKWKDIGKHDKVFT